jgi:hypothetical protein
MNDARRTFLGLAALGTVTAATLLLGNSHSLSARGSTEVHLEGQAAAVNLENAFVEIADSVGPATVSISAKVDRQAAALQEGEGGEGNDESVAPPFEFLFPRGRSGPRSVLG